MVGVSQRRSAVRHLQRRYSVSERCGCEVTGTHRSTHRDQSVRPFSLLNLHLVSGRASSGALLAEVMCTVQREKKRYSGREIVNCAHARAKMEILGQAREITNELQNM